VVRGNATHDWSKSRFHNESLRACPDTPEGSMERQSHDYRPSVNS